jgi:hypothetical protein
MNKVIRLPFLLLALVLLAFSSTASEFTLKMKGRHFVPEQTENFEGAITPLIAEKNQVQIYRIIQFYDIPSEEDKKRIEEAGINLISYIPNKAFYCGINVNASPEAIQSLNVRSVFSIDAALKISPELKKKELPSWAIVGDDILLYVKYFTKADKQKALSSIQNRGGSLMADLNETKVLYIKMNTNLIDELAESTLIQWIEPVSQPHTKDDLRGRTNGRANGLSTQYQGGRKYDGSGVVVALCDDGVVGPHIDFEGRVTQHTTDLTGSHGDMTSGIFVGAGNLNPKYNGFASGADLNVYVIGNISITGYPQIYNGVANLANLGTVISSTSYSQGNGGFYTTDAEFTDEQIYSHPNMIHLFSAGNSGTLDHNYGAGPGWGNISGGAKAAKNVICAGNLDYKDILNNTSSRGPAADGRIKPDLCIQGNGQMSTDVNNTYQQGGGTSASSPAIAGVVTQLYQAYKELNGGVEPETGLLKAALMNTAEDLGNPGPDFKSGWGRVNGLKAVRILEENRYIYDTIAQNGNNSHVITVPANVSQVRIMTYWTDHEGNPSVSVALVNDINMQVVSPDTTTYDPWVLDHTPTAASLNANAVRGVDSLNNVEQVSINNPAAGNYTININGNAIPQGPQTYFVVYDFVYNGVELTYPIGGEGFAPGSTETIRWDASDTSGTFTLAYSTDSGSTYTTISNSVSSNNRYYNWVVPNIVSGAVKLKVSRGTYASESDTTLSIIGVPKNLTILYVCPDSIELGWDVVSGASSYEVSMLGIKYMDSIGTSTTNSFKIYGLNPNNTEWLSVRAIVADNKGQRAIAIEKGPGTINCILTSDIELVNLVSPPDGVYVTCKDLSQTNIVAKIRNLGALPASSIQLNYTIGAGAVVTETLAGPIAAGTSLDYVFNTKANLGIAGNYAIKVWAVWATDQNIYNDTVDIVTKTIGGNIISTFPHIEDFESFSACPITTDCELTNCTLGNGWNNIDNLSGQDDIDWRTDAGGTASSSTGPSTDFIPGTGSGKYLYLEASGDCKFQEAQLLSPCIDLSSAKYAQLTFSYHMYGSTQGELHVDIFTQDSTLTDVIPVISGDQGNVWKTVSVDLSAYEGDTVIASIRGITGSSFYSDLAIDGFKITTSGIGIEDFGHGTQVTYYPNPSDGHINFIAAGLTAKQIEFKIVDVFGRVVFSQNFNTSATEYKNQIDISSLAKGIYFIQLKSGNESRVDRIILN